MIKAILYSSCTGSCKKYAQMMSEATGVPAYPVKEYKAKFQREKVAYVGWLFGGFVIGVGGVPTVVLGHGAWGPRGWQFCRV